MMKGWILSSGPDICSMTELFAYSNADIPKSVPSLCSISDLKYPPESYHSGW